MQEYTPPSRNARKWWTAWWTPSAQEDTAVFDFTRRFDFPILDWIAEHLWCPFLDAVMPVVTHLGDGGILWIALAILLLCLPKYRKTGLAMGIALLMGLLICNLWLKPWIGRIRPFAYASQCFGKTMPLLIDMPKDFSFPSGHTIAAFEAATVLLLRHKKWGAREILVSGEMSCMLSISCLNHLT